MWSKSSVVIAEENTANDPNDDQHAADDDEGGQDQDLQPVVLQPWETEKKVFYRWCPGSVITHEVWKIFNF